MYKVFIDQYVLIFEEVGLLSTEENAVEFTGQMKPGDIISYFPNSKVIFVLCENVDKDFKSCFSEYEKIEAAGGIVQFEDKFLVIKRHGKWDIPKGKIEKGEPIKIAAVREVEEECGLEKPVIESKLVDTYHTYVFNDKPVLKKTYWYLMSVERVSELTPQLEEGITDVVWMKKEQIETIRSNTFSSIHEVLDAFTSS